MANTYLWGSYLSLDVSNWVIIGLVGPYVFADNPGASAIQMGTIPHTRGSGFDPVSILGTDWTIGSSTAVNDEEFLYTNLPEAELTYGSFQSTFTFDITPTDIEEGDRFRIPVGAFTLEIIDGTNYSGGPPVECSSYLFGRVIKWLFGMEDLPTEDRYLGLHDSGVEISGGGYTRYHFAGFYQFDESLAFYSVPTATIDGWGIYDAPTGGNLLISGSYETAWDVVSGDAFIHRVHAADSFLTLDIL